MAIIGVLMYFAMAHAAIVENRIECEKHYKAHTVSHEEMERCVTSYGIVQALMDPGAVFSAASHF